MADPPSPAEVLGRAPQVGDRVGDYYVESALGAGGKAAVYKARRDDGLEVALKVLHPASLDTEDYKRFEREYEALRAMSHPNVVRVVEAGREGSYPWLALELVQGPDLGTLIDQWKEQPSPDRFEHVERILLGLCKGLQYVHEQGLIHRDLKPSNVLVTPEGEPKITDFGVVKDPHAIGTQLTVAGRLVGTVAFMAPEQITGERVDPRADLYALGAVLYMMLTFTRPIEANSVAGYLARHLTEVPRAPGEVDPAVPPRLEAICLRLLMKDPHQRYPSARAVLEALSRGDEEDTAPLRGREAQLTAWARRLDALVEGAGGTLAITGAPGSGRTHTLRAMLEEARAREIPVAATQGWSADPLRDLVRAAGGTAEPLSVDEQAQALASLVSERPLVLAIDDLDAVDSNVTQALGRLLRHQVVLEAHPLLVVYTTQPEDELAAMARGFPSSVHGERISLPPLDRMTTVALVRDRGVLGAAAPVLGSRLHADLGGLPGAVIKQLRTLEDEGWLRRDGSSLRATRPLDALRSGPLPVPPDVRQALETRIASLSSAALEICSVLALLDRPAGTALLARCASDRAQAPGLLDDLVRQELLSRREEGSQEILAFTHTSLGAVLVEAMSPERRRELHLRIARALGGRRRRTASHEVATHLVEAGEVAEAAPIFVKAGRRAAREGRWSEVRRICTRLCSMLPELPEGEEVHLWAPLLEGEARLAEGHWHEAVEPLQRAHRLVHLADEDVETRVLSALGRAWHRADQLDQAEPVLRQALSRAGGDEQHRAAATRSLADIALRSGALADSEALFDQALRLGRSREDEARAQRGLAHVRALQGRLTDSRDMLESAKDLLPPESSARVRAGILARLIELDQAAGRYGSALHRCDSLLDLVHARELSERLAKVLALTAESQWLSGLAREAVQTARHALTYARADAGAWDARLRVARLLCEAELWEEAATALPEREHLPADRISDPAGRYAVLRAWRIASTSRIEARDLATWALVRPAPLWVVTRAQVARDATLALVRAGNLAGARDAAKRGLRAVDVPGTDGLRLELLLALHRALPDPRVQAAAAQLADRVARSMPRGASSGFRQRAGVRAALDTIS